MDYIYNIVVRPQESSMHEMHLTISYTSTSAIMALMLV